MSIDLLRRIIAMSWPLLIAQLAGIGMMMTDTLVIGHYGTLHLAALAVGSGIYVAVILALGGVVQAVAPGIAHLVGAERTDLVGTEFQQGIWLALLLSVPGIVLLLHPDPVLALSQLDPQVEALTRAYLRVLACNIPALLVYRVFVSFNNGIGRTRPVMVIALCSLTAHVPLSYALVHGLLGLPPLGVLGSGWSLVSIYGVDAAAALCYLRFSPALRSYQVLRRWEPPRLATLRELARVGLPIGFSNFVETTSFTLIALFVAQLGAGTVGGHRIVSNLYAACFMLPLALASGAMVVVGQAAGARDWARAALAARSGILFAALLSALLGLLLWLCRGPLIGLYSDDARVLAVAHTLLPYVTVFLVFDAAHTLASFSLRGFKVTLLPMLAHVTCFWGIGLAGGWRLAFRGAAGFAPMGAAGFWLMGTVASAAAFLIVGTMLRRVARLRMADR